MKRIFYLLLFSILVCTAHGQTLKEQFDQLKDESETFKQYKVIDQARLNDFWSITADTLNQLKSRRQTVEQDNAEKAGTIESLNQSLVEKDSKIEELELQTSTIEVFGAEISKSTFIFISFFTSGALAIVLAFLIYQFKDNNKLAKQKVKEYEKLNEDFEEYKRKALEKQMKLRRDLQTERNKLEEARKS